MSRVTKCNTKTPWQIADASCSDWSMAQNFPVKEFPSENNCKRLFLHFKPLVDVSREQFGRPLFWFLLKSFVLLSVNLYLFSFAYDMWFDSLSWNFYWTFFLIIFLFPEANPEKFKTRFQNFMFYGKVSVACCHTCFLSYVCAVGEESLFSKQQTQFFGHV